MFDLRPIEAKQSDQKKNQNNDIITGFNRIVISTA